ncbi:hypothetical protein A5657_03030 [Mycobacterium kubicae]|nr:hypothetical protein A5657_03030 [Mycobacterium kubicae]
MVDRDDMGAIQSSGGVCFAAESALKLLVLRQVSGQDLDGNDPVGVSVMCSPNLSHAAPAQQLQQPVAPERRPLHLRLPSFAILETINRAEADMVVICRHHVCRSGLTQWLIQ